MTIAYADVYLSPHYDDASLSCGGAIHDRGQSGRPALVVTVFAAPPEASRPLSPFAGAMHQSWGNPADMTAVRQAEDQASMQLLQADYLRLNLTDCIYRGRLEAEEWYYPGEASLFGPIHSAERALLARIVEAVEELAPGRTGATIYAPLAVGHHVDHQLARAAAWQLRPRGWAVAFYEDYPYADPAYPFTRPANPWEAPHTVESALAARRPAKLQPRLRYFSEESLQAKIKSVQAYTSQLGTLFGGPAEAEKRLRAYALHVGQGRPAERIWLPE